MEHTYMTTHVDIRGRFLPASESLLIFTREKIIKWCEQRKVASDVWSWRSSVHGVPLQLYPYDFKIFTLFVWNRGARAPVYLCVWKSEEKTFSFSPSSWFMRQSLFCYFWALDTNAQKVDSLVWISHPAVGVSWGWDLPIHIWLL